MANSFFQFKKFRIEQKHATMKVTTDACLFGAWAATFPLGGRVLDIGTGTGLLTLMLAQMGAGPVDAIEIQDASFHQAVDNVTASPWRDRIRLHHQSIQSYARSGPQPYDLIVSNPPFYRNHYRSQDADRNRAHHHDELATDELIEVVDQLLATSGAACILYPEHEARLAVEGFSQAGLTPSHEVFVHDRPGKPVLRVMLRLVRDEAVTDRCDLYIKSPDGSYSEDFIRLLSPYYLYL